MIEEKPRNSFNLKDLKNLKQEDKNKMIIIVVAALCLIIGMFAILTKDNTNTTVNSTTNNDNVQEITEVEVGPHYLEADDAFEVSEMVEWSSYDTDIFGNQYSYVLGTNPSIFTDSRPYIIFYVGDGNYTTFNTTLYVNSKCKELKEDEFNYKNTIINIYFDDYLAYTKQDFSKKDQPITLQLDMNNVQYIKIEMLNNKYYPAESKICLGNTYVK